MKKKYWIFLGAFIVVVVLLAVITGWQPTNVKLTVDSSALGASCDVNEIQVMAIDDPSQPRLVNSTLGPHLGVFDTTIPVSPRAKNIFEVRASHLDSLGKTATVVSSAKFGLNSEWSSTSLTIFLNHFDLSPEQLTQACSQ